MQSILKKDAYRKLMEFHGLIEKELRSRWRLCHGRTVQSIEAMLDLMVRGDSWEDRTNRIH